MRPTFVKLLLAITVSAMVVLAVTGAYVVAVQSQQESIFLPPAGVKALPSQAPQRGRVTPYIPQPQTISPDAPGTLRK